MDRIKRKRKELGLSQQQVAEQVGIERTVYLRIENGVRLPKVDVAISLADLFGTTVKELF